MFASFVIYKYISEHILSLSLGPFYQLVVRNEIIAESTAALQDKSKSARWQVYQVDSRNAFNYAHVIGIVVVVLY
jgi:hypothetical protein